MKILIHPDYGKPELSLSERTKPENIAYAENCEDGEAFVYCIETKKGDMYKLVEIPDGVPWTIIENDGYERVLFCMNEHMYELYAYEGIYQVDSGNFRKIYEF